MPAPHPRLDSACTVRVQSHAKPVPKQKRTRKDGLHVLISLKRDSLSGCCGDKNPKNKADFSR
jgi:hypothetical protein